MHNLLKRLKKRGWADREIKKTVKIAQDAKHIRLSNLSFFEKRIYWILLLVIITINFTVSIAVIPLLVALNGFFLYLVLITLGLFFGLVLEVMVRSIEHLEKKHHAFLALLIPMAALVNIFIITGLSNSLSSMLHIKNAQNSATIALTYAASFAFPYLFKRFFLKTSYYLKE